jgi:hypothetical protein
MSSLPPPSDLSAEVFLLLRRAFFADNTSPLPYPLRDKGSTQDDPFDEYVHRLLQDRLSPGAVCEKAPGQLISPDLVVLRPDRCNNSSRESLASDLTSIVAVEVKKLERSGTGKIARASGMDYNTTPPCGTVRVYDRSGQPLDVRGFYLFVSQELATAEPRAYALSALVLCDGNILNEDFGLYLSIVGRRTKQIDLGTYGDGLNRQRPMLVFSNPLGVTELDRKVTLVHSRPDLEEQFSQLRRIGTISRTPIQEPDADPRPAREFYCYRLRADVPPEQTEFALKDPFPKPQRSVETQGRGRFVLKSVSPSD